MRCLSLADALTSQKVIIRFVVSDYSVEKIISRRGYDAFVLNSRWNDYMGFIEKLVDYADKKKATCIVTDSYYAPQEYYKLIHKKFKTVVITEDLPNKALKNADLFVNYNMFMNDYVPEHSLFKMCLGTGYALLRSEFAHFQKRIDDIILVLSGGTDPMNIGTSIVKSLVCSNEITSQIVIVTSSVNPYIEEVRQLSTLDRVTVLENVDNMAMLMQRAKIAISAGGSTLYELCACGVPTVTYSFVENQLENVLAFEKAGIMPYAGDFRNQPEIVLECIIKEAKRFDCDRDLRITYSKKMRKICDGKGAFRVASCIIDESNDDI
jgi:spore coat polysaccharide biosynthesis predicted glycosyltransferase SpsG